MLVASMKIFALAILLALQFQGRQFGDYLLNTVPHGLGITSVERNREFLLGVNGDDIHVSNEASPGHLALTVDNKFLQIFSVPLTEFNGTAANSDLAVVRQYMESKIKSYHLPKGAVSVEASKLKSKRNILVWSFEPHLTPQVKQQLFLAWRYQNYIVVLGSAVAPDQSADQIKPWLIKVAETFFVRA